MDDTDPSSTPLDLLLNAITEGGDTDHYDFQEPGEHAALGDLGGLLGESVYDFPPIEARPDAVPNSTESGGQAESVQDERLRQAITQLILSDSSPSKPDAGKNGSSSGMSSIQVWHPTAAQKSYKNERRLIVPPPFVRASGPILQSLTSLTLSAVPILHEHASSSTAAPTPSSSQTHQILSHLPMPSIPVPSLEIPTHLGKRARGKEQRRLLKEIAGRSGFGLGLRMKSAEQGKKDLEMLQEGVTFPGLWIGGGEDKGPKMNGFRLVLDVHAGAIGGEDGSGGDRAGGPSAQHAEAGPSTTADLDVTETDYNLDPSLANPSTLNNISSPAPSSYPALAPASDPSPAWTTLSSSPIGIVSKPSIRTAKSRSISSSLPEDASFALWVRIHSQSVRTKYMMLDDSARGARLTSRTGRWTPFRFEMIRRAELPGGRTKPDADAEGGMEGRVLTYGSIVRLVDVQSGTKSETVKLVKVEKNEVLLRSTAEAEDEEEGEGREEGQPVSELQKIGMIRVDETGEPVLEDGKRTYLSAPGARLGGGELRDPSELKWVWIGRGKRVPIDSVDNPHAAASLVRRRSAEPSGPPLGPVPDTLDEAALAQIDAADLEQAFGMSAVPSSALDTEMGGSSEPASKPRFHSEKKDPDGERPAKRLKTKRNALAAAVVAEEDEGGDQTVCTWQGAEKRTSEWETKVGKRVSKSQVEVEVVEDWMCWIMGGVDEFTHTFFDPSPDPTISAPKTLSPAPRLLLSPYFATPSKLQLTLSTFFTSPSSTSRPEPLSVFLGPLGPLDATTWRSTWRATSLKQPSRAGPAPCLIFDGEVTSAPEYDGEEGRVRSAFSALVEHTIVLVDLPKLEEVLAVMRSLRAQGMARAAEAAANHQAEQVPPVSSPANALADASAAATAAGTVAQEDAAWMDAVTGFDASDVDGNEAIRQALQSVSQAAEAEAVAESARAMEQRGSVQGELEAAGEGRTIDPDLQDVFGPVVPTSERPTSIHLATPTRPSTSHATPGRIPPAAPASNPRTDPEAAEMVHLPILLVRKESEMVFGLGRSLAAERDGAGDWRLRVVDAES